MTKNLFLLSLCLFPFVAFSSTFTSENPIDLPTTPDNIIPVIPSVLDVKGEALQVGSSYRIISLGRGAAGGDVYLGPSPNSTAPCPDGVFRYNSDVGPSGMPVRFIKFGHSGPGIHEREDINIQFNIATSRLCVSHTIWKVGDYDVKVSMVLFKSHVRPDHSLDQIGFLNTQLKPNKAKNAFPEMDSIRRESDMIGLRCGIEHRLIRNLKENVAGGNFTRSISCDTHALRHVTKKGLRGTLMINVAYNSCVKKLMESHPLFVDYASSMIKNFHE
ncbi:hypothetical protein RND71_030013 [Anisodus tanguticus]|uniref:Uncharacterized protein n=1 Tax=Anisodus tanguticus TaxID=243964 RepID=A0AAE1RFK9_9SOLA|nr:hypothetical protein RND71_030013 [Anisodus tanguticus]